LLADLVLQPEARAYGRENLKIEETHPSSLPLAEDDFRPRKPRILCGSLSLWRIQPLLFVLKNNYFGNTYVAKFLMCFGTRFNIAPENLSSVVVRDGVFAFRHNEVEKKHRMIVRIPRAAQNNCNHK
jgi:hypothetical protein